MYGLPTDVKFCTRCVISNQRPNSVSEFRNNGAHSKETIQFDSDGICSACRVQQEMELINWDAREQELIQLLEKYRSKDGSSYDVVVPGSGGKDSAFTAHILKYKYGMNPLTVTWAPHLYTSIGWENFTNWMHVGGLDNLLYTPNGRLHRTLTKLAFLNLCHPFQPFIIGQKLIGPMLAKKFGIRLIMYGENPILYGNSKSADTRLQDRSQWSCESPWGDARLGSESIKVIMEKYKFTLGDFKPYIPLTIKEAAEADIDVYYLGYYLKWVPQDMYYYACNNTGFRPAPERTEGSYSKYSSIDDKVDPFHYYTTLIKFGLGRASYDAAQEIRSGFITREEGVCLVKKYDQEFPKKYFKEFLEYINIDEEQFHERIDASRPSHLWEKNLGEWKLKHVIT